MENFRSKFINAYLEKVYKKFSHLNDWEQGFVNDIKRLAEQGKTISNHQFNTLKEIAESLLIKR